MHVEEAEISELCIFKYGKSYPSHCSGGGSNSELSVKTQLAVCWICSGPTLYVGECKDMLDGQITRKTCNFIGIFNVFSTVLF